MPGKHSTRDGDLELRKRQMAEQKRLDAINSKRRDTREKNTAYQGKLDALRALIREGAQKVDLAFPAYWKPSDATGFRAVLLKRDDRDIGRDGRPFVRWHWKNTGDEPLSCRKGRAEDGIVVDVPVGGIFTTSDYKGLPLQKWRGFEVTVIALGQEVLPPTAETDGEDRDMWVFEAHLMPDDIARIESQDEEDMLYVIEAQRQGDRAAIAEMARLNSLQKLGLADKLQEEAEKRAQQAA